MKAPLKLNPKTGLPYVGVHRDAARTALDAYGGEVVDESNLRDLLADLMHYCDGPAIEWDFDTELEAARAHYRAEVEA